MATLEGLRVLVVEDDMLLSLMLSDMVSDLGGAVAGSASRVAAALELVEGTDCDVAILDLNLNGERVDPVAERLVARGVPIVFATGYGETALAPEFRGRPTVIKPFTQDHLVDAIKAALARERP